jgi:hypothetical protein
MDLNGTPVDLLNLTEGCSSQAVRECGITDTVNISPASADDCASGLVIGASPDVAQEVNLTLSFTMSVRRARPVTEEDPDADGIANEEDNCPWAWNPDQRDDNMDGTGNRCSLSDGAGGFALDSDGDGVPDRSDNCVWISNPGQENTTGVAADGLNDGIGDACDEQTATVVDTTGSAMIRIALGPIGLAQPSSRPTYITVDINDELDCGDWTSVCRLDPSKVRLCIANDIGSAGTGCP